MILTCLTTLGMTWLPVHENAAPSGIPWWQFGDGSPAVTAGRSGNAAAVVLALALVSSALRTSRARMRDPEPRARDDAQVIIAAHGEAADMLAVTGDKMLMFGGDAVLSCGVRDASWIAFGAPSGADADAADLAWAFHDTARAAGARPVFYDTSAVFSPTARDLGLSLPKMGEEAIVPLTAFPLDGSERKKPRTRSTRAGRDGLTPEVLSPPHSDTMIVQLRRFSDAWLPPTPSSPPARSGFRSAGSTPPGWRGAASPWCGQGTIPVTISSPSPIS